MRSRGESAVNVTLALVALSLCFAELLNWEVEGDANGAHRRGCDWRSVTGVLRRPVGVERKHWHRKDNSESCLFFFRGARAWAAT